MPETQEQLPESEAVQQYTFENFVDRWPENGFENSTLYLMWRDAQHEYTGLPYHNFDHILRTLYKTMELADECEANGIEVNRRVLIAATLFHDAGFHLTDDQRGNQTKEELAGQIFLSHAYKKQPGSQTDETLYGLSEEEIICGYKAILATAVNGPEPKNIEDKILIRADLDNISGDYKKTFRENLMLLYKESVLLEKLNNSSNGSDPKGISPDKQARLKKLLFMRDSIVILSTYLQKDLKLGDFDKRWSSSAVMNVGRLIEETAAQESIQATMLVGNLGNVAVKNIFKLSPFGRNFKDQDAS